MVGLATQRKRRAWLQVALIAAILVGINILSGFARLRFDLTEDNRYTLGEASRQMLENLDDVIFVRVYLEGDNLPPAFEALSETTRHMLREFRALAGDNIQFEFIDPNAIEDRNKRQKLYKQLSTEGLEQINLEVRTDEGTRRMPVFPGAMVVLGTRSVPVTFLQQQMGVPPQEQLNNSMAGVEYALANGIRKVQQSKKPKIAFTVGHGELRGLQTQSIRDALDPYYRVDRVDITGRFPQDLYQYEVLVLPKPDSTFAEYDKYKLDQYVMQGGRVLWLVESLIADLDSLNQRGVAVTADYPLNLIDDQLFNYGVRINRTLVQDLQCNMIPIVTGSRGGQPQTQLKPWPYFPLVSPKDEHPIVNNLNTIKFEFCNTLDTVGDPALKKTILLRSSDNSRVMHHPARINLQMVRNPLPPRMYTEQNLPLAVLVEGSFTSLFKNRIPEEKLRNDSLYRDFRTQSDTTRMIVVGDGDVIANQVGNQGRKAYPLGYDRFTQRSFGNKNFLLNCIDYLAGQDELMQLRAKEFKLRLLDKAQVQAERRRWQIINLGAPVVFVVLFGWLYRVIHRYRYAR
jgi:ABC-2 type transport system permease protein